MKTSAATLAICLWLTGLPGGAQAASPASATVVPPVVEQARALAGQGKIDEAEALLRQAARLSPQATRLYYELGTLFEQRGSYEKAIAAYKEGIRIHEQGRR